MLFFAIIGSFFLAAILKVLAMVLSIEKRSYWQCYRAIFFSFCLLIPLLTSGFVTDQVLLFIAKFVIFGAALLLGLNASIGKSSIIAVVLSLLFTVSINEAPQKNSNTQAFTTAITSTFKAA